MTLCAKSPRQVFHANQPALERVNGHLRTVAQHKFVKHIGNMGVYRLGHLSIVAAVVPARMSHYRYSAQLRIASAERFLSQRWARVQMPS
jgi:hypothetical protein